MTSGRPGDPAPPPRIGAGTSRSRRPSEQVANFPVAGRGEVLVPTAHRMERLGDPGTDDHVDLGAERRAGLGRGDRYGHDDLRGPAAAEDGEGRPQAGAGGHPVIDEDDDPAAHRRGLPVAPIGAAPPPELLPLGGRGPRRDRGGGSPAVAPPPPGGAGAPPGPGPRGPPPPPP